VSIKKELRAYYAKQGLTGKHLRKALQWDMKAVTAAYRKERWKPVCLMDLHWSAMPSTRALYWAYRHLQTGN
jgi:hypothetical protein